MDAAGVKLVTDTWALVAPDAEMHGIVFFKHVFEIAPGALQLFSFKDEPDLYNSKALKKHALSVMTTVGKAVGALTTGLGPLVPVLEGLGLRHKGYGVLAVHYDVVGQALLQTLADGLGAAFTPEVKAAWTTTYGIVSSTMISGAAYENVDGWSGCCA
ncbi:globin-like protein [Pelagophyceae sp. CCMP2097]|nr:globin-like protein [Pelagophyceae sp. CCMP2097]|mmetsp:Transcript_13079/g.45235  ORF Transcript_13079/g.45235 Transcript_13079/m.45235 type:complete len:158 (+) Transcript_13079:57-530(+)